MGAQVNCFICNFFCSHKRKQLSPFVYRRSESSLSISTGPYTSTYPSDTDEDPEVLQYKAFHEHTLEHLEQYFSFSNNSETDLM